MKANDLLDLLGDVDDSVIADAKKQKKNKKIPWVKWGATAACLCLVVIGAFALRKNHHTNTLQNWNEGYSANDYFRFCETGEAGGLTDAASLDSSAIPYDETRYFSDLRSELEQTGVIPANGSHPLFTFAAHYNADGSLYCMELLWSRRSSVGWKEYSDLKVIAGHKEIPIIRDVLFVETDDSGHVLEPAVTVTERDGVPIVARGRENAEKSLTFQTENGWYQVSGSWNDSYDSVVELMDWFWEHPIDFTQFPVTAGDSITVSTLAETPGAFPDVLPDFAAFGFVEESTTVLLKNGCPVQFEGHYVAHVEEDQVKNQAYYDVEGHTAMHWCVLAEPDVYELDGCLGDIRSLTKEQVLCILEKEDHKIKFTQDGLLIIVYPDNAAEAWELIESLQDQ